MSKGKAIAFVVAAWAAYKLTSSTSSSIDKNVKPKATRGVDLLELLEAAEVPQDWRRPLLVIAWRESKWNANAKRTTSAERAAATKLYNRNRERFACSGKPASAYTWGSGGYFGFLPGTAVASAEDDCGDPRRYVLQPRPSIVSAVGYARWLARRWLDTYNKQPTPLVLMARWGGPGRTPEEVEARRDASFTLAEEAFDASPEWFDEPLVVDEMPSLTEVRERLGVVKG